MSKLLKKKREDLGSDVKAIASHTRIKETWLRAIEEEDYNQLPIEVYTRGYIKEYAKYLDMPADSSLEPYEKYLEALAAAKGKKSHPVPELAESTGRNELSQTRQADSVSCKEVKIPTETLRAIVERAASWSRFVWKGILLLIVAAAVVYQFFSSRNAQKEPYIPPVTSQGQLPNEVAQPQPRPEEALKTEGANVTTAAVVNPTENQPSTHKKHVLEIAANDTAWVQVVMDGATKKEALMKQGDNATYEANETVSVVIGNGGGVSMKFDGSELPAGRKGQVMRLFLPEKKSSGTESENPVKSSKNMQKPPTSINHEDQTKASKDNATSPSPDKPAGTSQP